MFARSSPKMMPRPLKPSLEGWKRFFMHIVPGLGFHLETFLRGMETHLGDGYRRGHCPLKPSLEGWKRESEVLVGDPMWTLKPSLEGWKPFPLPLKPSRPSFLETFLRGMETVK